MSWFSHRRTFIIFLLILSLVIFAYVRRELFLQQAKKLLEQNLEQSLRGELAIERIRAGLFYGLVLENIELSFLQTSGFTANIKVAQAWVDYNLWQMLFANHKDVQRLRLLSPEINLAYSPEQDIDFAFARVEQGKDQQLALRDFELILEEGQISFAQERPLLKNLHGRILVSQKGLYFQNIRASFKENLLGALKIYGEFSENHLSLTANVEHLKFNNFDILTNLSLTLDKKLELQDKTAKISGTLKTYGSVLNSHPFPELSSAFEIRDTQLRIYTLSLGDNYDLRGIVELSSPFNVDLSLNFHQAVPSELVAQFNPQEVPQFSGLLNGLLKITGALSHPKVEGYLEAKQGHFGKLDFVSADINIKGRYPKILIEDSHIYRQEGYFIMEGEIDLTSLERQNFLDVEFKADQAIFWQGWDITRGHDNQVHLSKDIADDVKITFHSFMENGRTGYDDNYRDELGLEYMIFGNKLIKLRLRKDEGILGLERRIRF